MESNAPIAQHNPKDRIGMNIMLSFIIQPTDTQPAAKIIPKSVDFFIRFEYTKDIGHGAFPPPSLIGLPLSCLLVRLNSFGGFLFVLFYTMYQSNCCYDISPNCKDNSYPIFSFHLLPPFFILMILYHVYTWLSSVF